MKKEKAIMGTIPYFGGEWPVTFEPTQKGVRSLTTSMSGYGEFPFDRFPNIPVVDFRENWESCKASMNLDVNDHPGNGGNLKSYLKIIKSNGGKIIW